MTSSATVRVSWCQRCTSRTQSLTMFLLTWSSSSFLTCELTQIHTLASISGEVYKKGHTCKFLVCAESVVVWGRWIFSTCNLIPIPSEWEWEHVYTSLFIPQILSSSCGENLMKDKISGCKIKSGSGPGMWLKKELAVLLSIFWQIL